MAWRQKFRLTPVTRGTDGRGNAAVRLLLRRHASRATTASASTFAEAERPQNDASSQTARVCRMTSTCWERWRNARVVTCVRPTGGGLMISPQVNDRKNLGRLAIGVRRQTFVCHSWFNSVTWLVQIKVKKSWMKIWNVVCRSWLATVCAAKITRFAFPCFSIIWRPASWYKSVRHNVFGSSSWQRCTRKPGRGHYNHSFCFVRIDNLVFGWSSSSHSSSDLELLLLNGGFKLESPQEDGSRTRKEIPQTDCCKTRACNCC